MLMDLVKAEQYFESNGFIRNHSTKKVVEYISRSTNGIIYLRTESGFPEYAYIVVHPDIDISTLIRNDGIKINPKNQFRHSSNMLKFPKRINGGKNSIPYGRCDSLELKLTFSIRNRVL